jgi:3-hydroxy-9,10-secoandrosta-1,3,5(10)-triene-9,17-dione monooxygenase
MQEQELIDRIKALVPLLEQHAEQAERDRKPVDAVMKAIEDTGAYRYFVPKAYGGYEFSLEGFMDLGMALGEGCLSTAWVVTFCMEHNWLLGLYDKEAQDDIFGRQPYIIAPGALAPKGQAVPVEGGYRVTGRWEWGTGVMHADWVMVGALTPSEDPQRPELCMFLIPRDLAEVVDTWHMAGMVGTGSNDIEVKDVFVPGHLKVNLMDLRAGESPGARLHDSPTYRMPMLPVLGLTAAAPAVGCARKAVSLFRERLQGRTVYGTTTRQGERGVAQVRMGLVEAAIRETEIQLVALAREVSEWGASGESCPELERAALRVRIGRVVRSARDIVRDVVEASGAHAHFLNNPLQRALRDVHTLSCHTVFDLDISAENYGRLLLGYPASSPV